VAVRGRFFIHAEKRQLCNKIAAENSRMVAQNICPESPGTARLDTAFGKQRFILPADSTEGDSDRKKPVAAAQTPIYLFNTLRIRGGVR
jgi:hypothetical protein